MKKKNVDERDRIYHIVDLFFLLSFDVESDFSALSYCLSPLPRFLSLVITEKHKIPIFCALSHEESCSRENNNECVLRLPIAL